MRLLNVGVSGFRNVTDTVIELGGINAIVSPNNYGKSNLLDAISFGFEFMKAGSRQRESMMRALNCMPLNPRLENDDFCFSLTLDNPSLGEYRFVRYSFAFAWLRDDGTGCRITDETIEIGSRQQGPWTNYLKRAEGKYKKSHATRSFRSISLDDTRLAIDVLTSIEDIDINGAIRSISEVTFDICDSLDTDNRFMSIPLELKVAHPDDSAVMFDDEDLSRSLFRLSEMNPERYEDFQAAIYTLFPEFEEISAVQYAINPEDRSRFLEAFGDAGEVPFRIKDELYRLMIKSSHVNQPVDVSYMSMGTKRIIWLVANVMIAGSKGAGGIGIEEVETSIHPHITQELLEILNENIGDTSLLLTSHSPYLVQYLKPEKIYIGVPNEDGVAKFRRLRPSKVKEAVQAAYNRGFGFGEYLFSLMSDYGEGARVLSDLLED
ncbi:MAG: AAA family ATPase [Eggerthellaceae bacterium]